MTNRTRATKRRPDPSFVPFVLDQLASLPEVRSRAMFGGHGIYSGGTFFAIVHGGCLYFRVDDATRAEYEARGMKPFAPMGSSMRGYWEVPTDVLEHSAELARWAQRALLTSKARLSLSAD